jgi:hypothetical protein
LTILELALLLKDRFSVFMVDSPLILKLLTRSDYLKEDKKYHMKDHSAILCGLIQLI